MEQKSTKSENLSLNASQIYGMFRGVDVKKKSRRRKFRPFALAEEPTVHIDDGLPLMERAQRILGKRMQEKRGFGYYLDGKPASSLRIAEAAGLSLGT